jgi:SAM-dependent methyltransferase
LLDLRDRVMVLDVDCGHGRIANRLAGRGCHVTGLGFSAVPRSSFRWRCHRDADFQEAVERLPTVSAKTVAGTAKHPHDLTGDAWLGSLNQTTQLASTLNDATHEPRSVGRCQARIDKRTVVEAAVELVARNTID